MAVPYDYYRIFYYVAKYRSLTRAAKILLNSQPNVTRAMNNLERELGCRLFQRSHRGVTLTPEGERLFLHVQIAQEQLMAGEAELAGAKNLQSGTISIGVTEIALHGLVLPVLRRFRQTYPGIHIQVHSYSTPQAAAAVRNGAAELAAVTTPTGADKPLKEIPVVPFQDILVAGPGFSELREGTRRLEEIAAYPLVGLGRDTRTYEFFDRLFEQQGLVFQPDVEAATMDHILPMVKFDLGLGFLPAFFAESGLQAGEIFEVRLREPIPMRSICLLRDTTRPLSAAARELERMLRAQEAEKEKNPQFGLDFGSGNLL